MLLVKKSNVQWLQKIAILWAFIEIQIFRVNRSNCMLSSNHWSPCYIYSLGVVKLICTLIDCHCNIFFTFQFSFYYYFFYFVSTWTNFLASSEENLLLSCCEIFLHLSLKLLLYIIVKWHIFSFFLAFLVSPCLQMPIREACHVAVQRNHPSKHRLWKHAQARQDSSVQGQTPVLQIVCVIFFEVPLCTTHFTGTFFFFLFIIAFAVFFIFIKFHIMRKLAVVFSERSGW